MSEKVSHLNPQALYKRSSLMLPSEIHARIKKDLVDSGKTLNDIVPQETQRQAQVLSERLTEVAEGKAATPFNPSDFIGKNPAEIYPHLTTITPSNGRKSLREELGDNVVHDEEDALIWKEVLDSELERTLGINKIYHSPEQLITQTEWDRRETSFPYFFTSGISWVSLESTAYSQAFQVEQAQKEERKYEPDPLGVVNQYLRESMREIFGIRLEDNPGQFEGFREAVLKEVQRGKNLLVAEYDVLMRFMSNVSNNPAYFSKISNGVRQKVDQTTEELEIASTYDVPLLNAGTSLRYTYYSDPTRQRTYVTFAATVDERERAPLILDVTGHSGRDDSKNNVRVLSYVPETAIKDRTITIKGDSPVEKPTLITYVQGMPDKPDVISADNVMHELQTEHGAEQIAQLLSQPWFRATKTKEQIDEELEAKSEEYITIEKREKELRTSLGYFSTREALLHELGEEAYDRYLREKLKRDFAIDDLYLKSMEQVAEIQLSTIPEEDRQQKIDLIARLAFEVAATGYQPIDLYLLHESHAMVVKAIEQGKDPERLYKLPKTGPIEIYRTEPKGIETATIESLLQSKLGNEHVSIENDLLPYLQSIWAHTPRTTAIEHLLREFTMRIVVETTRNRQQARTTDFWDIVDTYLASREHYDPALDPFMDEVAVSAPFPPTGREDIVRGYVTALPGAEVPLNKLFGKKKGEVEASQYPAVVLVTDNDLITISPLFRSSRNGYDALSLRNNEVSVLASEDIPTIGNEPKLKDYRMQDATASPVRKIIILTREVLQSPGELPHEESYRTYRQEIHRRVEEWARQNPRE